MKAVPARARNREVATGLQPGLAACPAGPPGRAIPRKQTLEFVPARPRGKGQRRRGEQEEQCGGAGKRWLGLEAELGGLFYYYERAK